MEIACHHYQEKPAGYTATNQAIPNKQVKKTTRAFAIFGIPPH